MFSSAACAFFFHVVAFTLLIFNVDSTTVTTQNDLVVNTTCGLVRGMHQTVEGVRVRVFLGVPYSEPRVGETRFERPSSQNFQWNGTYNATYTRPICMQPKTVFLTSGFKDNSQEYEDCLYLNIWSPLADDKTSEQLKPVLVVLHGGSWVVGSANHEISNGSALAALEDIVVVTIGYRLGVFGLLFAETPEYAGNIGLWDQTAALKWIHKNIANFGGDPHRVTLMGWDTGAVSVHLHTVSPQSRHLFQAAILQGNAAMSAHEIHTRDEALRVSNEYAKYVGCTDLFNDLYSNWNFVVTCLKNKSAEELQMAFEDFSPGTILRMKPIYGEEFLPLNPITATERGMFNRIPVLLGNNRNEGTLFMFASFPQYFPLKGPKPGREDTKYLAGVLLQAFDIMVRPDAFESYVHTKLGDNSTALAEALDQLVSDVISGCPMRYLADMLSRRGLNVFSFEFNYRSSMSVWSEWMGATHNDQVQFFTGLPLRMPSFYTDQDRSFAKYCISIIGQFVRKGTPRISKHPQWPYYNSNTQPRIVLSKNFENNTYPFVTYNWRSEQCQLWKPFLKHFRPVRLPGMPVRSEMSLPFDQASYSKYSGLFSTLGNTWMKVKKMSTFV